MAITSITGSAIFTPGVERTVSRTDSENPDSPAEICSVALPASFSIVTLSESISVTLVVRIAKKTATPSATPKVVSVTRSRWRPHCRSVTNQSALSISVHRARPGVVCRVFADELAVAQCADAMAAGGGIGIVRDEHHGGAKLAMKIVEETENFVAGFRVEFSGGLVCQQQRRIENESAGDGDALAFAAGKFIGQMPGARAETDAIEKFRGAQFGFAAVSPCRRNGSDAFSKALSVGSKLKV